MWKNGLFELELERVSQVFIDHLKSCLYVCIDRTRKYSEKNELDTLNSSNNLSWQNIPRIFQQLTHHAAISSPPAHDHCCWVSYTFCCYEPFSKYTQRAPLARLDGRQDRSKKREEIRESRCVYQKSPSLFCLYPHTNYCVFVCTHSTWSLISQFPPKNGIKESASGPEKKFFSIKLNYLSCHFRVVACSFACDNTRD
jgi:hypothetical protein